MVDLLHQFLVDVYQGVHPGTKSALSSDESSCLMGLFFLPYMEEQEHVYIYIYIYTYVHIHRCVESMYLHDYDQIYIYIYISISISI